MQKSVETIQNYAKWFKKLEENQEFLFEELNKLKPDLIVDLINQYTSEWFQPVNLLRLTILNSIRNGERINPEYILDVKQKIVNKEKESFSIYGEIIIKGLSDYPIKSKSPFHNWSKCFNILFPFFFNKNIKEEVDKSLQTIVDEIHHQLEIPNYESHIVNFYGPNNYGSSVCWIAGFPSKRVSHKKAYQLFLEFDGESIIAGINIGDDVKDGKKDLQKFNTLNEAIVKLQDSIKFVDAKNQLLINYWKFSPGESGKYWNEFYSKKIMAIGWDKEDLGDLTKLSTEELAIALKVDSINSSNDIWGIENFRDASIGDIVIANKGKEKVLGIGVIVGEYSYDPSRSYYKHVRSVDWKINEPIDFRKGMFRPDTFSPTLKWDLIKEKYIKEDESLKEVIENMGILPSTPQGNSDNQIFEFYSHQTDKSKPFIPINEFDEIVDSLKTKKNVILQGPPGVGKTFIAKKIAYAVMGRIDECKIQMIQFHQSYSYEDFIEGIKPAKNANGFGFEIKKGIFFDFCKKAEADIKNDYFLIIDEINRGNLSKIFGELMMLIECDKRGDNYKIPLMYSGVDFSVPENVFLIGTMNTADRSLALVDYALRRRFRFHNLSPCFEDIFINYMTDKSFTKDFIVDLSNRLKTLNKEITNDKELGASFQIGHSFFSSVTEDSYKQEQEWYKKIIISEIKPLLEEYWFDNPQKVETEIGKLKKWED